MTFCFKVFINFILQSTLTQSFLGKHYIYTLVIHAFLTCKKRATENTASYTYLTFSFYKFLFFIQKSFFFYIFIQKRSEINFFFPNILFKKHSLVYLCAFQINYKYDYIYNFLLYLQQNSIHSED